MTASAEKLILEAIDSGREYLPRLYSGLDKVVGLLRAGYEGEAIQIFNEALDGIEWMASLTQALLQINIDGKSELLSSDWYKKAESLKNNLQELTEAWANSDFVLIGDLIEYEILPYIELLHQQEEIFATRNVSGDN